MGRYSNTRSKEKIIKRGEKDKVNYNITSLKSTKYDLVPISDKGVPGDILTPYPCNSDKIFWSK